jgi:membrane associated rhomboid family serine protease
VPSSFYFFGFLEIIKFNLFFYLANAFLSDKDPRKENFWDMVNIACYPNFKFRSFIFLKILASVALYLIALTWEGVNRDGALLSPKSSSLFIFGEKYPFYIYEHHEIYRLLTSLFLNCNIFQLTLNTFGDLIFGSYVEKLLGFFKTILIFLIFGIGGTLLSCIFMSRPMIDSTSAVAGFIGLELGNVLISWNIWDYPGSGKYQMVFMSLMGLILIYNLNYYFEEIDGISMIGSFGVGLVLSFIFVDNEITKKKKARFIRYFAGTSILLYFIVILGFFFFLTNIKAI